MRFPESSHERSEAQTTVIQIQSPNKINGIGLKKGFMLLRPPLALKHDRQAHSTFDFGVIPLL